MNRSLFEATRAFCNEIESLADRLEARNYAPDDEVGRFIHRIRGVAGLFGALRVARAARAIEEACAEPAGVPPAAMPAMMAELVEAMRRDSLALREMLEEAGMADPVRQKTHATRRL